MSIETAMVALKTANSTLSALLGTGGFSPDKLPQKKAAVLWDDYLPACRFQVISRIRPDYTFGRRAQLSNARVQLDGFAKTSALRTTLRSALIGCFLPLTRVNGTYGGESLLDIRIVNERQGVEMLDTETECYRISLDLIVDLVEA